MTDRGFPLIALIFVVLVTSGCVRRIIDDPVFIVGGDSPRAGMTCNQEFEAVPCSVRDADDGVAWFASLGFNRMTYAEDDWWNWSGGPSGSTDPGFPVPVNANDPFGLQTLSGDSWSTYSSSKNLAFFYFIGRPPTASCVAVAATAPEKLSIPSWDFPATCLTNQRGDQCAILHIDRTNTFYVACGFSDAGSSNIRIEAYDDCANAPGPAYGCPQTAQVMLSDVNLLQFSISENPCTGNLAFVYRKGNSIRLRFYDEDLQRISDTRIRNGQSYANGQTNPGCRNGTIRRCGLGTTDCAFNQMAGQCLRDNGRPSIDTYKQSVGGGETCGAVIAYNSLTEAEDGNLWSKARLDLVDITDEKNIEVEVKWNSTDDEFAWNHYLTYATVSDKGANLRRPKIAWFWLTDIRGACSVIAEGATTTDLATSMQPTGILSGPFPAVHTNSFGMGDYFRGIKGGDHEGSLLVSWGEPIQTTSTTCTACQGSNWNLSTKITRIRWGRTTRDVTSELEVPGPVLVPTEQ